MLADILAAEQSMCQREVLSAISSRSLMRDKYYACNSYKGIARHPQKKYITPPPSPPAASIIKRSTYVSEPLFPAHPDVNLSTLGRRQASKTKHTTEPRYPQQMVKSADNSELCIHTRYVERFLPGYRHPGLKTYLSATSLLWSDLSQFLLRFLVPHPLFFLGFWLLFQILWLWLILLSPSYSTMFLTQ